MNHHCCFSLGGKLNTFCVFWRLFFPPPHPVSQHLQGLNKMVTVPSFCLSGDVGPSVEGGL